MCMDIGTKYRALSLRAVRVNLNVCLNQKIGNHGSPHIICELTCIFGKYSGVDSHCLLPYLAFLDSLPMGWLPPKARKPNVH